MTKAETIGTKLECIKLAEGNMKKAQEIYAFVTSRDSPAETDSAPQEPETKPRRKRRTKAEIEADKAAKAEAAAAEEDAKEAPEEERQDDTGEDVPKSDKASEDNIRALSTKILGAKELGVKKSDLQAIFQDNGAEEIAELDKKGRKKTYKALKAILKRLEE